VFGFVDSKCFNQEFLCTDNIKLQVGNETDIANTYALKIQDQNLNTIETVSFNRTTFTGALITPALQLPNINFTAGLSPWLQSGSGSFQTPWNWVSAGLIKSDGTSSAYRTSYFLYCTRPDGYAYGWPPGTYTIQLQGNNSSTGPNAGTLYAQMFGSNDGFTTDTALGVSGNIAVGNFTINITFTTSQYYLDLGFYFNIGAPGNVAIVSINSAQFTAAPTNETYAEYDLSFVPNILATPICDQYVKFIIQQNGADAYKSDFVLFSSTITTNASWDTKVIQYLTSKNFAGINGPNDGTYFSLRVPARFFEQRIVSMQDSLVLSNSKVINTSVNMKYQQLFEPVFMPDYMLNKIHLALTCSVRGSVNIDGVEWIHDESFDRQTPDPRFAFRKAKTWLTRKNYYVRNII